MNVKPGILAASVLVAAIGCQPERGRPESALDDGVASRAESPNHGQAATRSCLVDSALVYSDISQEPETGDKAGFEITLFTSAADISRGTSREASGEIGESVELAGVQFNASQGALRFGIPNGPDTSRFVGRFSCDSVWGLFTAYRNTPSDSVVFRRAW